MQRWRLALVGSTVHGWQRPAATQLRHSAQASGFQHRLRNLEVTQKISSQLDHELLGSSWGTAFTCAAGKAVSQTEKASVLLFQDVAHGQLVHAAQTGGELLVILSSSSHNCEKLRCVCAHGLTRVRNQAQEPVQLVSQQRGELARRGGHRLQETEQRRVRHTSAQQSSRQREEGLHWRSELGRQQRRAQSGGATAN